MSNSIIRLPEVISRYARKRSSIYNDVKIGLFPKPIHIGTRTIGWPLRDVEEVINARIAGLSEAEIRKLVIKLEQQRLELI